MAEGDELFEFLVEAREAYKRETGGVGPSTVYMTQEHFETLKMFFHKTRMLMREAEIRENSVLGMRIVVVSERPVVGR